jgi:hypothetical protein
LATKPWAAPCAYHLNRPPRYVIFAFPPQLSLEEILSLKIV